MRALIINKFSRYIVFLLTIMVMSLLTTLPTSAFSEVEEPFFLLEMPNVLIYRI